jgi:hypothetical protein
LVIKPGTYAPGMSNLVLAAAHAQAAISSVDWVARGLAGGSLAVSAISVYVTVTLWRRSGWSLSLKAWYENRTEQIYVKITNKGRLPCTVSKIDYVIRDSQTRTTWNPVAVPVDLAIGPTATVRTMIDVKNRKPPAKFAFHLVIYVGGRPYRSGWVRYRSSRRPRSSKLIEVTQD